MNIQRRLERIEQSREVRIAVALSCGDFSKLTDDELQEAIAQLETSLSADWRAKGLTDEEIEAWHAGGYYYAMNDEQKAEYEEWHGGPPQLSEHEAEVMRQLEARLEAQQPSSQQGRE